MSEYKRRLLGLDVSMSSTEDHYSWSESFFQENFKSRFPDSSLVNLTIFCLFTLL